VNLSRNAYRRGTTPAWTTETYGSVAGVSADLAPDLELDLVPWHIPNVRLHFSEPKSGVATGAWRAPAHVANGFAVETLLDEIAAMTGRSAVDLRLGLYGSAQDLRFPGDEPSPYNRIGWRPCCVWPRIAAGSASGPRRVGSGDLRRTTRSAPIARRSRSYR
jgi:hypothetical protein